MFLLGTQDVGIASVAAAATLAAVRTIDFLVRKKHGVNGTSMIGGCRAKDCHANDVEDRLREYHEENRDVLRDIRDGINKTNLLLERRKNTD